MDGRYISYKFVCFNLLTSYLSQQNSIRHNLSLNASFCKAERPDGLQMKKGCYWMITPERRHIVESEIQRFLMQEGRNLIENGDPPNTTNQPTCEINNGQHLSAYEITHLS